MMPHLTTKGKANKLARPHKPIFPSIKSAHFYYFQPAFPYFFNSLLCRHLSYGCQRLTHKSEEQTYISGLYRCRQHVVGQRCQGKKRAIIDTVIFKKTLLLSHVGEIRFIFCHWLHSTQKSSRLSLSPLVTKKVYPWHNCYVSIVKAKPTPLLIYIPQSP